MEDRGEFFKKSLSFMAGAVIFISPLAAFVKKAYGKTKEIILPKGTQRQFLIQKNPRTIDTRNLEVTPLKDFETMGVTDYRVDPERWRLEGHREGAPYTHLRGAERGFPQPNPSSTE